jgi:UDP-N-acetylmuramoylalanine--D-glutamate ligase
MELEGRSVLVVGLGLSGRAAAAFLLKRGAAVSAVDHNTELLASHPEIIALRDFSWAIDLVVVSPGVPPTNPHVQEAQRRGIELIGEVELACRFVKQPCIGITGSNGKTTTTLLVEHILNHAGKPAKALGNVGVPLTAALDEAQSDEILVLELSSWQLETLSSPVLEAAALLNITPNHLDRHGTLEAYARAKLNMAKCLKPGRPFFILDTCAEEFAPLLEGISFKTYGYSPHADLSTDQIQVYSHQMLEFILPESYRGWVTHDVENLLAAYALCKTQGVSAELFLEAFKSFRKPPHRIEYVKTLAGVSYYDDSKGTSLDAVAKAVASMKGATILIAGGVHKGAAYTPWVDSFGGKVRCVCAIGQAAELIQNDLEAHLPVHLCENLESAVIRASQIAQEGENVLLSPGCASYDMFKDYKHRGEEFKRIVHALS